MLDIKSELLKVIPRLYSKYIKADNIENFTPKTLKDAELIIAFFTISLSTIIYTISVLMKWMPSGYIILIVALQIALIKGAKTNDMAYLKLVLSIFPVIGPYMTAFTHDRFYMFFGMIHSLFSPIFSLLVTRSPKVTTYLWCVNLCGNLIYFQPKFHEIIDMKPNDQTKQMILYGFLMGFMVVIIILISLWYLFECLKKLFDELYQQKMEINKLNEELISINKELNNTLKSKEDYLLHISHEIRNPLNIIGGTCEMILLKTNDLYVKKSIKYISSSIEIITYFLNNLLDGAKMDINQLEIVSKPIKTWELIKTIWDTTSILIKRKRLNGKMFVDKNIPWELNLDPVRIIQIIYNLVSNASKFTVQGYVGIFVTWIPKSILNQVIFPNSLSSNEGYFRQIMKSTCITEKDEQSLRLIKEYVPLKNHDLDECAPQSLLYNRLKTAPLYSMEDTIKTPGLKFVADRYYNISAHSDSIHQLVNHSLGINDSIQSKENIVSSNKENKGILKINIIDSGCGMNQVQTDKLFKKFVQVGTNSQKQIGTGLGLVISRYLCKSMKGDLQVSSQPGCGSNFVATITCD